MQVKIADFGLSKAFATEFASHISTHPGSTPGYIDPESWNVGYISKRSDMYSFGIILLELVTGKPAVIIGDKEDRINIINWIDPLIKRGDIQKIIDPRLKGEFNINTVRKAIKIAVSCVKPIKERPDISQVLTKLKECLDIEMDSRVLDETGRTNVLIRLYRNIRQNRNRREKGAIMKSVEEQPMNLRTIRRFSCRQLAKITSNFKNVIGEGEFGKVYLGTLNDGAHVAVKILSSSPNQGHHEFQTEVEQLSQLYHKNVVSLVGYCEENDIKALVNEYMANGNLKDYLLEKSKRILSWDERLQIAIDIAGLEYLQIGCKSIVIHRNLKTSNILLTENMRGKIGDFRLATFLNSDHDTVSGSLGSAAPECFYLGKLNSKTDLYCFGLMLLELLTGLPLSYDDGHEYSYINWIITAIRKGDIQSIIDPRLQGKFNINSAWKATKLAMSCASPATNRRPDISYVLLELKKCLV